MESQIIVLRGNEELDFITWYCEQKDMVLHRAYSITANMEVPILITKGMEHNKVVVG